MATARSSPSGRDAATLLRGANLTVNPDDTLSPLARPRRFFDWDYFLSAGTAASQIGRMRWNLTGVGTATLLRLSANFASGSKLQVNTGAVANNTALITLGSTASQVCCNTNEFAIVQTVWQPTTLAGNTVFFGWSSDFAIDPLSADCTAFGFAFDTALSSNLLIVNRVGAALQVTPTSLVMDTNPQLLSLVNEDGTRWRLYGATENVAATALGLSVQSTLLGTVDVAPFDANHGYRNQTRAAALSRINLGYWGATSSELGGVFSADDFLEF